ncbi:MAG: helix-turn-helix transcriptional regulator [Clostridia bacterium]|nr:helix-turn-helix transcriptional regulator [Clostridia bacterium]
MNFSFSDNRIAELREEQHLSQRQLAQLIGTSNANLSRWEQGLIVPSVLECWKLADFFGVSIDFLCGRSDY